MLTTLACEPIETTPPLVVDLDGTLIRTDLLLECLLAILKERPLSLLLLPIWLLRGRAYLKSMLAERVRLQVKTLPYRGAVLEEIANARCEGRRVILATASHHKLAAQVAAHLGLFDAVLATDGDVNLKGSTKATAVLRYLNGAPFDYIGNSMSDQEVWKVARRAVVVASSPAVVAAARRSAGEVLVLEEPRERISSFLRMLRPHQWLKNSLVFLPILAAQHYTELDAAIAGFTAFLAFSLCASSVYILNDLLDLDADRQHPRKHRRMLASGAVPITQGLVAIPLLLGASVALSLTVPPLFLGVLAFYYLSTLLYSFWAKQRVIVDVLVLAGLYALRVLAGAAATEIEPSFWLLALSNLIFLSLALVKRYSELVKVQLAGGTFIPGRAYLPSDMPVLLAMGAASAFSAIVVMALYINSPSIMMNYLHPKLLWIICPMLLFWLTRLWMKANRGEVHEDPVVFAITDFASLIVGAICVGALLAGNW